MNCNEFHERVCELIDKRLNEENAKELLQHAKECLQCNFEMNALQTSKNIIRSKLLHKSVPADLYYSIINKTVNAPLPWHQKLFSEKLNPALVMVALAALLVGIYSLLFSPASIPDEANIINQSLANYQAAIGGTLKPQLVSNYDEVQNFLEREAQFAVIVPKVKKCKSFSGKCSDFKGVKIANVSFQLNGNTIYIYQTTMDEVMKGEKISLPAEAKDELAKTNWYVKDLPDNKTIVLWKYKGTLCAAVSDMGKDKLIALLTDKDHQ